MLYYIALFNNSKLNENYQIVPHINCQNFVGKRELAKCKKIISRKRFYSGRINVNFLRRDFFYTTVFLISTLMFSKKRYKKNILN